MTDKNLDDIFRLLSDKSSAKRRSAAKRLRKLRDPTAGPRLLAALEKEIRDVRTWETQYQMIMALAESHYQPAVPFLRSLADQPAEPMVHTATGDALVRIERKFSEDPQPILDLLARKNLPLIEGGLRAVAMLRLKLPHHAIGQIIEFASRPENEQVRFWVAAAAPGWEGPEVSLFLRSCATAKLEETRKAAEAALQKRYLKWSPL